MYFYAILKCVHKIGIGNICNFAHYSLLEICKLMIFWGSCYLSVALRKLVKIKNIYTTVIGKEGGMHNACICTEIEGKEDFDDNSNF